MALIGKYISLLYHREDPARVEIVHDSVSHGMLVPLDLKIDCRIRRDRHIVDIVSRPEQAPEQTDQEKYTGGRIFGEKEENTNEL